MYHIPISRVQTFSNVNDINREVLENLEPVKDYANSVEKLKKDSVYLQGLTLDQIINFFDKFSASCLSDKSNSFINDFSYLGVSFLINFLKKNNLQSLMESSLNGELLSLDKFVKSESLNKLIKANPRGIITHWLAGNVPILGMISLIQGILTKNTNIVKLPKQNGMILPLMVSHISNFSLELDGRIIKGSDIMKSCIFIYVKRDDTKSQMLLSIKSDVRIAWGGREAVETVMSLPRKYGTDDVIFGPKYSFAAVGKNSFDRTKLSDLTYRLALDASIFEQQGCNSPHTVFVEKGSEVSPLEFAENLALAMEKVLNRIPQPIIDSSTSYQIAENRSSFAFTGRVFTSKGTEWTVIYSTDPGLADACYHRTIFVKPVKDLEEILKFIEHKKHQTLGLSIDKFKKIEFAELAVKNGIERITELGKMSVFDYPWDGIFPINQLVRWTSLYP